MRNRLRVLVSTLAVATVIAISPTINAQEADPVAPSDVAAPPANASVTQSGLASVVLTEGTGDRHPSPTSWVRVHYSGWTTDGELFDSSLRTGKSATLPLDRVIDGWTEGMQLMVEGEKRRLWIPAELAYGGRDRGPQGMLVFDVELLEIVDNPTTPEHLSPPADAQVEKSGLATKVLEAGGGDRNPRRKSSVTVHYTGWTTDGNMFETTVIKGQPITFPLNGVIKGWTEGLQLMVEGEKRRLWIPSELAYDGAPGRPQGMLIFDVELIAITVY